MRCDKSPSSAPPLKRIAAFYCTTAVVAALVAGTVLGDSVERFAGTYAIVSNTVLDPSTVTVQLRVRVDNFSGADVVNARLDLTQGPGGIVGAFPSVSSAPNIGSATFQGTFDVPARQLEDWAVGLGPFFELVYIDASGNEQRYPIRAVPEPSPGEG